MNFVISRFVSASRSKGSKPLTNSLNSVSLDSAVFAHAWEIMGILGFIDIWHMYL